MDRPAQQRANSRHALTFAIVSACVLLLPVIYSPVNSQPITPLARETIVSASPAPTSQISSAGPIESTPQLQPTPEVSVAPEPTFDFAAHLRRMLLSLVFVMVLIGITLRLFGRYLPGAAARPRSFMNVLARESLGPHQSLALVQVGPKVLLVGLTDQSMTTLCEFSEGELAALLAPAEESLTAERPEPTKVYGDILRHYLSIVPGMGVKK